MRYSRSRDLGPLFPDFFYEGPIPSTWGGQVKLAKCQGECSEHCWSLTSVPLMGYSCQKQRHHSRHTQGHQRGGCIMQEGASSLRLTSTCAELPTSCPTPGRLFLLPFTDLPSLVLTLAGVSAFPHCLLSVAVPQSLRTSCRYQSGFSSFLRLLAKPAFLPCVPPDAPLPCFFSSRSQQLPTTLWDFSRSGSR